MTVTKQASQFFGIFMVSLLTLSLECGCAVNLLSAKRHLNTY